MLNPPARKLLLIYLIYSSLYALSLTFSSAFIWRYTGEVWLVILYSTSYVIGVAFAHLVNGYFLKKVGISVILFTSLIVNITSLGVFFLLNEKLGPALCLTIGFFVGFPGGFFWANRNYLSFLNTTEQNRRIFSFLEQITIMGGGAVSMFIFGAIIGLADRFFEARAGYLSAALLMVVLVIIIGFLVRKADFKSPHFSKYLYWSFHPLWNKHRFLALAIGAYDAAINLLIPLLVLNFLGNESILGTIEFVSLILSGTLAYFLGGTMSTKFQVLIASLIIMLVPALILGLQFQSWTVYLCQVSFIILNPAIQASFREKVLNNSAFTINIENRSPYTYVVDNELFLNTGRLLFFISALVYILYFPDPEILRYGLLIGLGIAYLFYTIFTLRSAEIGNKN